MLNRDSKIAVDEQLRLYIARHGETDYNLNKIFQGVSDIPLNENGFAQAVANKELLKDVEFVAAYHSPLSRAKVTCEMIVDGKLRPVPDERMKELYFGLWEATTEEEIIQRWPEQYRNYRENIGEFHPPEGEELTSGRARVECFYNELIEKHKSGNVLVVGHQMINALLCTVIMGQDIREAWDYRSKPGAVFLFAHEGKNIRFNKLSNY